MKIGIYLVIHQLHWKPGPRVFCTPPAVVGFQASIQISRPAAVKAAVIATEEVDIVHGATCLLLSEKSNRKPFLLFAFSINAARLPLAMILLLCQHISAISSGVFVR